MVSCATTIIQFKSISFPFTSNESSRPRATGVSWQEERYQPLFWEGVDSGALCPGRAPKSPKHRGTLEKGARESSGMNVWAQHCNRLKGWCQEREH